MADERLQKILSRAGISSRRAAEDLILAGRVQLNGKVVRELGTRADPRHDVIRVDDRVIAEPEALVYYVLYKPERVVTTLSDPEGRQAVGDLLRRLAERVYPVGRLDYDAEGVLLLTNDGDLAHKLTHPRWGVRRTYLAKVKGEPSDEVLARMKAGVRLEDGMARAIEATFEKKTPRNTWIRLVVAEGRHHLVKRMCDAVNHPVVRLFRSDYAGVTFDGLQPGEVRPLTRAELQTLKKAVEKEAPPPPGGRRRKPTRLGAGAVRNPVLGTSRRFSSDGPGGGGRSTFGDRPAPERGGRPAFGDRPAPERGGRPGFGDRPAPARGGRPGFGDRPAPERGGRPGFGDRPAPARGARPAFGDRSAPERGGRPGFGDRPAPARGGRPGFGDRPAPDRGERFGGTRGQEARGGSGDHDARPSSFTRWANEEGFEPEPGMGASERPRQGRPAGAPPSRGTGAGAPRAPRPQSGRPPRAAGGKARPAGGPPRGGANRNGRRGH